MNAKLLMKTYLLWFIFVIIAIINGGIREGIVSPALGDYAGHVISTIIFVSIICSFTYLFVNRLADYTEKDMILIGVLWTVTTILFEFMFGHFIMGHSWDKLLADYNILAGRVWTFVLLASLISPWLFGHYMKNKAVEEKSDE